MNYLEELINAGNTITEASSKKASSAVFEDDADFRAWCVERQRCEDWQNLLDDQKALRRIALQMEMMVTLLLDLRHIFPFDSKSEGIIEEILWRKAREELKRFALIDEDWADECCAAYIREKIERDEEARQGRFDS